jgi:hypothetical protein
MADTLEHPTVTYIARFRLSDGTTSDARFTTRRRRALGEIVNLPATPDGSGHTGSGYIWRVSSVEAHADPLIDAVLVLDYERPNPDKG